MIQDLFYEKISYYRLIASIFGNVGIVWVCEKESPLIIRAVFPRNGMSTIDVIRKDFPDAEEGLHKKLEKTCGSISAFLDGARVNFSMKFIGI
ncbi:MAG: hypothetical protein U9R20_07315, partial [Thermodesulfobacteriota bacterium]|nr:hypothetical protein [Thermodesulfobacteriota bacterium]